MSHQDKEDSKTGYNQAISYINQLCQFGINLGLERTKKLLALCGNPDQKIKIIHIAGTNGKGSTAAMLNACMQNAGFETGLYTSPHLHSYRERIQVSGVMISEEEFAAYTNKIRKIIDEHVDEFPDPPTEFEFLTVLAALFFYGKQVDFAVFETGLGGRLDSTNALETDLTVITAIGCDHQDILGDSMQEIAAEKAAVIRDGGKVVIGIQDDSQAENVIVAETIRKKAEYVMAKEICYKKISENDQYQQIITGSDKKEVILKLAGNHQIDNMLSVLAVFDMLAKDHPIDKENFYKGFSLVFWPGRLESFIYKERRILLDVAHNLQGVKALRTYLDSLSSEKVAFLGGFLDDKDKAGMIHAVIEKASMIIVSRPEGQRAAKWNQGYESDERNLRFHYIEKPEEALHEIIKETNKMEQIVVFGSFYFVSKIREVILKDTK